MTAGSTYFPGNKYSPVLFSQGKYTPRINYVKTAGSTYFPDGLLISLKKSTGEYLNPGKKVRREYFFQGSTYLRLHRSILEIFKNNMFYRIPPVAVSVKSNRSYICMVLWMPVHSLLLLPCLLIQIAVLLNTKRINSETAQFFIFNFRFHSFI